MQDASIFREEALRHRQQGQFSALLNPPKISHIWMFLIIIVISMLATGWLVSRQYVRYQSIKGFVEPDLGLLVHRANISGRVEDILVGAGTSVTQGQVLMTISALDFDAVGARFGTEQKSLINSQLLTLSEQDTRIERLAEMRRLGLDADLVAAELQWQRLQEGREDQQQILALAQQRHQRMQALLAEGNVSQTSADDVLSDYRRVTLQAAQLQNQVDQEARNMATIKADLAELPVETAQALSRNQDLRDQLQQRLLELSYRGHQTIVAAADGVVDEIAVKIGEEVRSSDAVINLLPAGSQLMGKVLVPSFAAGFVEVGQTLYLRYDAYPYQKYGTHLGHIVGLTSTPTGDSKGNFYYSAQVALDEEAVLAHGRQYRLKTGMSFEADVMLSRRTFMEWLLEPLYSLRGNDAQ